MTEKTKKLWGEMDKAVIGRKKEFTLLLTALLTEGHVLFEDLPGTGKTTMVKAFAAGLDCQFTRVQCTPDLLPSDVLGGSIFNPQENEFHLRKGPIFTNVLLVDEINRALPRTQSSLLECMEERQVTIEGNTHVLPAPFIVLATQNPVDMEGTFPLPEAQVDRFLMKIELGYPTKEDEKKMLLQVGDDIPYEQIARVFTKDDIVTMQTKCKQMIVHEDIAQYITDLAHFTRSHPLVEVGISPRGTKALYRAIKSWAYVHGRTYVTPDDVKAIVHPVWVHRIRLKAEARMAKSDATEVIDEMLETIAIPKEQVIRP